MFITTLIIIAKNLKLSMCSSTGKWTNCSIFIWWNRNQQCKRTNKQTNETIHINNMDESQKHAEWKKTYTKKYILYYFVYVKSTYKDKHRIVKKSICGKKFQNNGCLWLRVKVTGMGHKWSFWCDRNHLHLNVCIRFIQLLNFSNYELNIFAFLWMQIVPQIFKKLGKVFMS